jgi:ribosomal protein S18 acetylase RimI-like enzyme
MTTTLPAGMNIRAASEDDLQAICNLVNACEQVETGRINTITEHIQDQWEETDLAADTVVLATDAGQIVGYTGVSPDSDNGVLLDPHTSVHPDYQNRGLEKTLLELADERAHRLIDEADPPIPAQIKAWAFNTAARQRLEQAGYHVTMSDLNLEIFLSEEPATPQDLANITVRSYKPGQDERAVHEVIQETFQDIGGRPRRPFEYWEEGIIKHRYFDSGELYVALSGEQIIGAITCRTYMDEVEGPEGHIAQLGVLRAYRRRGIARHLMQRVFASYYRRGVLHLTISVDGHNVTGARELYESMGMRLFEQVDNLVKVLEPDAAGSVAQV